MSEAYKGSTSHSEYFFLQDSTTGLGKTGLVYTDITGSYTRAGGSRVGVTMATLAAANSAFSSGGFKEVDATNQPGLYRFDVPDAAYATGAAVVTVSLKASSIMTSHLRVDLIDWNKQVAAIPNAASGTAGGLASYNQVGTPAGASLAADVANKTGYKLAPDGLDAVSSTEPTGVPATFPQKLMWLYRRFAGKVVKSTSAGTITVYQADGSTAMTEQPYTSVSGVDTVNEVS